MMHYFLISAAVCSGVLAAKIIGHWWDVLVNRIHFNKTSHLNG